MDKKQYNDEIPEDKLNRLLEDKEALKLITKCWIMRQEIRLLQHKIDKLDAMIKQNQQQIVDKYELKRHQVISLYILEDVLFSKKVVIESKDLDEIADKLYEKYI